MNQGHGYQPTPPELCALPYAAARDQLPTRHDQARALFRKAKEAYESGKVGPAAKQFLEVAELLTAPDAAFAESFAKMRAAAYRNASMAFVFARDGETRKRAFQALIKSDPQNAALLKELLAG